MAPVDVDNDTKNWLKVGLALKHLKNGLLPFVRQHVSNLHTTIINTCGKPTCNTCTTENVLPCHITNNFCKFRNKQCQCHDQTDPNKRPKICPNAGFCQKVSAEIKTYHKFKPAWTNTDAKRWGTNAWEIAKCYMSPGYDDVHSDVDTDCTGILSLCLNCRPIEAAITPVKQLVEKNRTHRNEVMHCGSQELTDTERDAYILDAIALLSQYQTPIDPDTQKCIDILTELNNVGFILTTDDIVDTIQDALKTIGEDVENIKTDVKAASEKSMNSIETLQTNKVNQESYMKKVKELDDNIKSIDSKFQQFYGSSQKEVKAHMETIRRNTESMKTDIGKRIDTIEDDMKKLKQLQESGAKKQDQLELDVHEMRSKTAREAEKVKEIESCVKELKGDVNKMKKNKEASNRQHKKGSKFAIWLNWCGRQPESNGNDDEDTLEKESYTQIEEDELEEVELEEQENATDQGAQLPEEIKRLDAQSIEVYKEALSKGKIKDHEVRVMIVGHLGVGKSTLRKRLHGESVRIKDREPTSGIDVHTRRNIVSLKDGKWRRYDTGNKSKLCSERIAGVVAGSMQGTPDETSATNQQKTAQEDSIGIDEEESRDRRPPTDSNQPENTPVKESDTFFGEDNLEEVTIKEVKVEIERQEHAIDQGSSDIYDQVEGLKQEMTVKESDTLFEDEKVEVEVEAEEQDTVIDHEETLAKDSDPLSIKDELKEVPVEELEAEEEENIVDQDDHMDAELKTAKHFEEIGGVIAVDTSTDDNSALVSIWDFAGDSAFYTSHQVFLTNRSVYLLVTDISKHMEDIVNDDCFGESFGKKKCQVKEFVEFWLKSIQFYCDSRSPNVILVATHTDKLNPSEKTDKVESYFCCVRELFSEQSARMVVEEEFAIDNSIAGDPELGKLKQTIMEVAKQQSYWGTNIPAHWITLEKAFSELREKGEKIITRTRYNNLPSLPDINNNRVLPLKPNEIDVFLTLQHDLGTILYFSNDPELREYILLDPQWVVDAIKCIITAKKFCSPKPAILKMWKEFVSKGILKRNLIDAVWNSEKNNSFWNHREHLLRLMQKLDLIARPCDYPTADTYFVPSVLKNRSEEDIDLPAKYPTTSHLCYKTTSGYIPTALFNRILAACTTKWRLYEQANRQSIFCGCGKFTVDDDNTHQLTIFFRQECIQLWVTRFGTSGEKPDTSVCFEVRIFVERQLERILNKQIADTKKAGEIQRFIKCPMASRDGLTILIDSNELRRKKEVHCTSHYEEHMLVSKELLQSWFDRTTAVGPVERIKDKRIKIDVKDEEGLKRQKLLKKIRKKDSKLLKKIRKKDSKAAGQSKSGISLNDFSMSPNNPSVPQFIEKCVEFIEDAGMHAEGIYRIPGNKAQVDLLIAKYSEDSNVDISSLDIQMNAVATVLKAFFADLTDPLVPVALYEELIEASGVQDKSSRIVALRGVFLKMHPLNFEVLKFLITHLHKVSKHSDDNGMDCKALSRCWGPTLIRMEFDTFEKMAKYFRISEEILQTPIEQYSFFFHSGNDI